jgi:hypothetical protein
MLTRTHNLGSNWIPADNHLTECTEERYRAWLQLMVDGNQNMVRVWGGGIYEFDYFYDICDELGLLVWQDFMFGCGQYPANKQFLESVQAEAEQAVQALRNHASLAIFVSGPVVIAMLSIRKYRIKELCHSRLVTTKTISCSSRSASSLIMMTRRPTLPRPTSLREYYRSLIFVT